MISGRKIHASERVSGVEKSVLDSLREELEGLHINTTGVARQRSALAKIRSIRAAYFSKCAAVFFKTDFSGVVRFMPSAGKKLLALLFLKKQQTK